MYSPNASQNKMPVKANYLTIKSCPIANNGRRYESITIRRYSGISHVFPSNKEATKRKINNVRIAAALLTIALNITFESIKC